MILSDSAIWRCIREGRIDIRPKARKANVRPFGLRIHLDGELLLPRGGGPIDLANADRAPFDRHTIAGHGYVIRPMQFVLASTVEQIKVAADLACSLDGRSTLARVGLMIHCSSSIVDNVHDNRRSITLELSNLGPFDLSLRKGMPIGMLVFTELRSSINQPSQKQYDGQMGATAPRKWSLGE